jgi:hypothetical protein
MNLDDRAKGLLKLVETYRAQECRVVLDHAGSESVKILRRAWRRERDHLHTSVEAERTRARALIQAARAERATRERTSGDRENARLLALAWPRIEAQLLARWQDPRQRELWVARTLAAALESLPPGPWTVRHAPDWEAPQAAAPCIDLAGRLAALGAPAPSFIADPELAAGLIVASGAARLDASLAGLILDRPPLEARLLALLASAEAAADPQAGHPRAQRHP